MEAFFLPLPKLGLQGGCFPPLPAPFSPIPACLRSAGCQPSPLETPLHRARGQEGQGRPFSHAAHPPPKGCAPLHRTPSWHRDHPKHPHIRSIAGAERSPPVPTKTQPHQPLPPAPLHTPQPPGPLCPAEHPHSSPRTGPKPPPCARAQADSSRNKASERLAWFLGDVEQSPARWKPAGISPSCFSSWEIPRRRQR